MIGVIADDLTGAAELGAVGLRYGLRAEILVLGASFEREAAPARRAAKTGSPTAPSLLCITTDSRSLSARQAAARARTAARLLRRAGAAWIYKKTDSVLRGQVVAELHAIMKEQGHLRALLLPANPSLGRTIRNGRYFVGGKPVHRTDFAHDPEHPRRSANVLRMLGPRGRLPIRVLHHREAIPLEGIVIGEVSSPRDVWRWVSRQPRDMLLAGGAETFATALRALKGESRKITATTAQPALRGRLFVCGSTSDACREFVDQCRRQAVPVIGLPAELARLSKLPRDIRRTVALQIQDAIQAGGRAILQVGLPLIHNRVVARRLTVHLAELAAAVLNSGNVGQVFAEGGETAAALLRRMGWRRLRVRHELAPGVASLSPLGCEFVTLTIKPGSYRWPVSVQRVPRWPAKNISRHRSGQQKHESVK